MGVQGGDPVLRPDREEALGHDPRRDGDRAREPVRLVHHDVAERGGRGAHAQDREGGGAAELHRPREAVLPPVHRQPRHRHKIEKEEERLSYTDPEKQCFHLCIVNLVIGTLYCAKGNFEFGISRIIKSLEPYEKKIGTDTWYYAKRCFLALAENLSKHMLMLKDASIHEIVNFLDAADQNGAKIMTVIAPAVDPDGTHQVDEKTHNVSYEARQLKKIFLKLRE